MSTFNNNRFTPGNKGNLRNFINRQYISQYYKNFNESQLQQNINNGDDMTMGNLCNCIQPRANIKKQGYNDPTQSENRRLARALAGNLGGRITFGNFNIAVDLALLEGRAGQPGGLPRPIRNKF
jgi:hypothetical protein